MLKDHPFVGVGMSAFSYELFGRGGFIKPRTAHNTILAVLFELGIIGCVLFVGIILSILVLSKHLPPPERTLSRFLVFTWLVGGFTHADAYQKATWFLFGLLGAMVVRARALWWVPGSASPVSPET